ncbi:hypothetical protein M2G33_09270 [Vibrio vulnificus]|nr:hypothetical protein [Vibrio vulnificus]MCU8530037.1 hypothetical protein [Vibrio vulnificus]
MIISLKAFQPLPIQVAGQWLHLEKALQSVTIDTENGDRVTLRENAVVKSQTTFGRIMVNSEIDQVIALEFGFGDFVPPQNIQGQTVLVSELPAVKIAPEQSVAVSALPAIELAPEQVVKVSHMPAVELAPQQQVIVAQLPVVQLDSNSRITVDIGSAIRISAAQVLRVAEEASDTLSVQQITAFPHTQAANELRRLITIKAHSANTQDVLINGAYPLSPGEKLELRTRAAIELTGSASNSVAILEI